MAVRQTCVLDMYLDSIRSCSYLNMLRQIMREYYYHLPRLGSIKVWAAEDTACFYLSDSPEKQIRMICEKLHVAGFIHTRYSASQT